LAEIDGYWGEGFYGEGFWGEGYWGVYGAPAAARVAPSFVKRRRRQRLSRDLLSLFMKYLELKLN